jgi:hypothetical protein
MSEPETAVDQSKIFVRAFKGFLWSPITMQLYYANNREAVGPSTYFRPYSVTLDYGFEDPIVALNPVDYPTPDTADACLTWARENWPTLVFDIVAPEPTGGFVTAKSYWLLVNNGADLYEVYGAGLWQFDREKDGEAAAVEQRTAELRAAGFSV